MKKLAIIIALAALGGCATPYYGPANYGTRAYAQPADANGWQVVSVTPVAPGTGAAASASGRASVVTSEPVTVYQPAQTTIVQQPVYVPAPVYGPVYAPAPVYADPYWYPPISIGLGFSWNHWSGGHRGGWGRGHR